MKNLEMVSLYGTGVTQAGVDRLHRTIPKASIYH